MVDIHQRDAFEVLTFGITLGKSFPPILCAIVCFKLLSFYPILGPVAKLYTLFTRLSYG